jgi:hypothetical protein
MDGVHTHTVNNPPFFHPPNTTKTQALMLDYQAKWPLSLVVSRRAVTKYQLLFRHLFLAKFVERRLHTAWAEQQGTKVRKGRWMIVVPSWLSLRVDGASCFLPSYNAKSHRNKQPPHDHARNQTPQELDLRAALGVAFCLRHRMQHFLENYVHYMLFEVRFPPRV